GQGRLAGGGSILRLASRPAASSIGERRRIERLELEGELSERRLTRFALDLRRMARDPGVVALVLQVEGASASWAAIDELRREILALRRAGKRVYAHLVAGTSRQYYLASAADKIYVDPAGGLRLSGFSSSTLYFKGLFD